LFSSVLRLSKNGPGLTHHLQAELMKLETKVTELQEKEKEGLKVQQGFAEGCGTFTDLPAADLKQGQQTFPLGKDDKDDKENSKMPHMIAQHDGHLQEAQHENSHEAQAEDACEVPKNDRVKTVAQLEQENNVMLELMSSMNVQYQQVINILHRQNADMDQLKAELVTKEAELAHNNCELEKIKLGADIAHSQNAEIFKIKDSLDTKERDIADLSLNSTELEQMQRLSAENARLSNDCEKILGEQKQSNCEIKNLKDEFAILNESMMQEMHENRKSKQYQALQEQKLVEYQEVCAYHLGESGE
jgi:hypothetical protein